MSLLTPVVLGVRFHTNAASGFIMHDENRPGPVLDPNPKSTPVSHIVRNEEKKPQPDSVSSHHLITFCAGALFICFFLPWVGGFVRPSGLQIAKEGGKLLALWAIPIFSALTVYCGMTKSNLKSVAQFTGAIPFFVLGFFLYNADKGVQQNFLHVLDIGAFGSLLLGLVMFIAARRLK